MKIKKYLLLLIVNFPYFINAQPFYLGADLSYVNEMEDCGIEYFLGQESKDPYTIFNDQGCNLVRLRLWHSPEWYDTLNTGQRYSNLSDVKKSIGRAKQNGMQVLLDFHLSDNWADPSKQLVPKAWLSVVDDVDLLKDSLYNYIHRTLSILNAENLLPEMIQIGNETNKGILLSPQDNQVWTLDWTRNATLFNRAIQAVRDFEQQQNKHIEIVLHLAGPANAEWLIDGFVTNGVTDFDIIGMSYYWAWHMPTTIADAGTTIRNLKNIYPDKEVLIVETGYIWTTQWNDNASNIISEVHPDYSPASPENQRDWLIDLTKEVLASNGLGVIYWEPAWQSSSCFTQWGQGSHQEHATFFDFNNQLLIPGGIEWMSYEYDFVSTVEKVNHTLPIQIMSNSFSGDIKIIQHDSSPGGFSYSITDTVGNQIKTGKTLSKMVELKLQNVPFGIYIISAFWNNRKVSKKIIFSDR